MLEFLRIKNLALIDDLELEFAPGLNVLTGETGAGKSFILKAINFLTGEKMPPDLIRPGSDKASAEALFVLPEAEHILRRELVAETGRSRFYVDDRLSSQEALRDIRPSLVLHTSQHAQAKLLQPSHQAQILDTFLPDKEVLRKKEEVLAALKAILTRRKEIEEQCRELTARRDLLEYHRQEIEKVGPEPGEEETLLERKHALAGLQKARESLDRALSTLLAQESGLVDNLSRFSRDLAAVVEACPELAEDLRAVEEFQALASELAGRLRRTNLRPGGRDDDVEAIEKRLWELSQLKRKLHRTLDQILSLKDEVAENLSFLDACGLDLARLEKEEKALASDLAVAMDGLNKARRAAARTLKGALEAELKGLGFSEHVSLDFEFSPKEAYPGIIEDRARILWIPNPGQPPQPLDKIASGGELSRFLLATVGLVAQADLPTLIFDEVDTGVGGLTLNRVGERIKSLSRRQQVILITHWPQLASLADRHFQVRKEVRGKETFTLCHRLQGREIEEELSRMAGGGRQGDELARQLVATDVR